MIAFTISYLIFSVTTGALLAILLFMYDREEFRSHPVKMFMLVAAAGLCWPYVWMIFSAMGSKK